ncbi:MAG TPA: hypothetical protein VNM48_03890 [Chloroflexota bacterium]|nr:hypothetical protein [Chloroflexota bacterium]
MPDAPNGQAADAPTITITPPADTKAAEPPPPVDLENGEPAERWDEERARRTIQQQRTQERQLKGELEELRAERKKQDDAKLSEQERLTKRATELETTLQQRTQHYQSRLDDADIRLAASALSFEDPGDAPRLLDLPSLDRDEDGVLKGVNAALKKLAEAKPYLLKTGQGQRNGASVPGTPRPAGPPSTAEQLQHTKDQLRATGLYST